MNANAQNQGEKAGAAGNGRGETYRRRGWWPDRPLVERYEETVRAHPDALALIDDRGAELTHDALWSAAERLAGMLHARGIRAGDVVMIVLPNWAEWHIAHLAIRQLKAIPANIPIRTHGPMMAHAVNLVFARCLIGTETFGGLQSGDILRAAAASADHRIDILLLDGDGGEAWFDNAKSAPVISPQVAELDHLMFTSSTTGMPKAVMHTSNSLASFNITLAERFDLSASTPIFMPSPLGHSVGAIHGSLLALSLGAPLVLQDKWNPVAALQAVERHGCDFTAAATPFLKDLLEADWSGENPKLSALRSFLCGGAQVPPALLERAEAEFPNTFVTVLWGMTEGGVTTCVPGSCMREKRLKTSGRPTAGLEIKVVDDAGAEQPSLTEGELLARGPNMFLGYFAQPDLNAELIGEDGFFVTGDRAVIDAEGYLRITGRSKDLIIRGGVNISPVPIEDAIAAHPAVKSVAVVGLPDARLGERICAVLESPKQLIDKEALVSFLAETGLAKHFWPEAVFHIDDMPMTPAGKIRKNDVRDWLRTQVGTEEAAS